MKRHAESILTVGIALVYFLIWSFLIWSFLFRSRTSISSSQKPSLDSEWVQAVSRLDAGETADVASFEPLYLKDVQTTPSPSPLE